MPKEAPPKTRLERSAERKERERNAASSLEEKKLTHRDERILRRRRAMEERRISDQQICVMNEAKEMLLPELLPLIAGYCGADSLNRWKIKLARINHEYERSLSEWNIYRSPVFHGRRFDQTLDPRIIIRLVKRVNMKSQNGPLTFIRL